MGRKTKIPRSLIRVVGTSASLDERLGVRFAAMSQFTNGAGARPGAASAAAHRAINAHRLTGRLPVRDPHDALPGELQVGVAAPVALEGRARGVVCPAVELHDEVVVRPVQVDLVAGHFDVRLRHRETSASDQRQEFPFRLGAGHPPFLADCGSERSNTASREGQELLELRVGDEAADLSLVDGVIELVGRGLREVADRPAGRGQLETVAGTDFLRRELLPVDLDAAPPVTSGIEESDLDRVAGSCLEDAPDGCRGSMAENSAAVEREDRACGCGQVRLEGADRIHASMEPAKPATPQPGVDGVRTDTGIEELTSRDRAVLPPCERHDLLIDPRRRYVDFGTASGTD